MASLTPRALGIPFWPPVVIAIGGTIILVTAVILPLLHFKRQRRHRRHEAGFRRRTLVIDEAGGRERAVSVYRGGVGEGDTSTETLERTGKLRKKNIAYNKKWWGGGGGGRWDRRSSSGSSSTSSGDEDHPRRGGNRSSYLSLPPVLPMIRRASSGFLSVANLSTSTSRRSLRQSYDGGETMSGAVNGHQHRDAQLPQRPGPPHHRRRRSNAWVDEDAIHGPEMNIVASSSPRRKGSKKKERTAAAVNGKDRVRRSWRRSIRDSWPLQKTSPTLPRVAAFGNSPFGSPKLPTTAATNNIGGGDHQHPQPQTQIQRPPLLHDAPSTFRFQHHNATRLAPPVPAVSPGGYSPPRQLPKPPRQALLAAHDESSTTMTAPLGYNVIPRDRGPSYWVYEDNGAEAGDRPAPLRLSSGLVGGASRRGAPSSESTLTHILGRTESRLVQSGGGGRRRSGRERSGTISTGPGNESNITLVGSGCSGTATPSPPKSTTTAGGAKKLLVVQQNGTTRHHSRGDSRDSVLSEVDSLLATANATSPEGGHFYALSSPGKNSNTTINNNNSPPRQHRHQDTSVLLESPNSGELSDLLEVDEPAPDEKAVPPPLAPRNNNKGKGNDDEEDPFVTLHDSRARRVQPVPRAVHAFVDAPLLQAGPGPAARNSRNSGSEMIITPSYLRSDSPLSVISGNSRGSPDLRYPSRRRRSTSPQHHAYNNSSRAQTTPRVQLDLASPPTSAVSSSATVQLHHRRNQLSTVADGDEALLLLLSPPLASTTNRTSPPAHKRLSDLRCQASSPTLGGGAGLLAQRGSGGNWRRGSLEPPTAALPPLPTAATTTTRVPSSYYSTHGDDDDDTDPMLLMRSRSSSSQPRERQQQQQQTSDSHLAGFERERLAALSGNSLMNDFAAGGRRRSQTIRLVSAEHSGTGNLNAGGGGGVLPTIAQLRRMNSQVSGVQDESSDGGSSGGNTPVLPTLREEDTGRFVRPPRRREASMNYLALGATAAAAPEGHKYRYHQDKENMYRDGGIEGGGLKVPSIELVVVPPGGSAGGQQGPRSPGRRGLLRSVERTSEESEYYDEDGFLMSPERRAARRR